MESESNDLLNNEAISETPQNCDNTVITTQPPLSVNDINLVRDVNPILWCSSSGDLGSDCGCCSCGDGTDCCNCGDPVDFGDCGVAGDCLDCGAVCNCDCGDCIIC